MKPKYQDRFEYNELSRYESKRDVNYQGLTEELIDDDVVFLKELLQGWGE